MTGSYFAALGIKPATGRLIGPGDDPGEAVAVIGWPLWKSRFNLDPAALGKQITVQDTAVTIVGVAPREFSGLQTGIPTDIWLPRPAAPRTGFNVVARLKPGVSLDQARAEMTVLYGFTIEERCAQQQGSAGPAIEDRSRNPPAPVSPACATASPARCWC